MSFSMTRRLALAFSIAALTLAPAASSLAADSEGDAYVDRAVAYLDGIASVKGHFTQTDERGGEAEGELYLSRPGRARFQYTPPTPMLITSDGKTVIVSDSRRKTFQKVALSQTPLAVFLADHIRLDHGVHVDRVDVLPGGGFSITARGAKGADGGIELYFAEGPMRLTGWTVTDAQGHVTRVTLGPLTPIAPPPDEFFTQTPG